MIWKWELAVHHESSRIKTVYQLFLSTFRIALPSFFTNKISLVVSVLTLIAFMINITIFVVIIHNTKLTFVNFHLNHRITLDSSIRIVYNQSQAVGNPLHSYWLTKPKLANLELARLTLLPESECVTFFMHFVFLITLEQFSREARATSYFIH